ncbi:MAG: PorT family protein [bacterium]|nr:PorT family protein [bacterium]
MRRRFWLLTIASWIVLCSALTAGEPYVPGPGLSLGFHGGLSLSHFSGASAGWGSAAGPALGIYATYGLNSIMAFQPEVLFVTKGADRTGSPEKITLEYCQFVGLFRINPPLSKWDSKTDFLPKILAGLAVGVKSSAKHEGRGTVDIPGAKGTDVGAILGGGFDIPVDNKWRISFDVRFDFSFSSYTDNGDKKNNSVVFLMGFAFR